MRRRTAALPVLALLLAACGTTVPLAQQQSQQLTPAQGLPGGVVPGDPQQQVPVAGGAQTVTAPGAGAPGAVRAPGAPTAGAPVTALGGTTRDTAPIRLGIEVVTGANEAMANFFPGAPTRFGDGKSEATALVNDLNKRGGIGGRKVVPVWGETGPNRSREAACVGMIEDGKASFILTVANTESSIVACAAKRGVPIINMSFGAGDDELYRKFAGYFYSPAMMSMNRELRVVLETLRARGRITSTTQVGVLIDANDEQYQRVYDATVDPMLRAWKVPHSSYAATASNINGGVLKFSSEGAKVVVFIAPSGIGEVLFMTAAEQQRFRPVYGIGDSASGYFISRNAPAEQLKGVFGAGAFPLSNVLPADYPSTPREKQCLKVYADAGIAYSDRRSSISATVYCEVLGAFAHVAGRVMGPLTRQSFQAAYAVAGSGYRPVVTFAVDFGTGRRDNASLYRAFGYTPACGCLRYSGPLRRLPT